VTWGFAWWQVLGSNQRRLSRRFYRLPPSAPSGTSDLRKLRHRYLKRESGPRLFRDARYGARHNGMTWACANPGSASSLGSLPVIPDNSRQLPTAAQATIGNRPLATATSFPGPGSPGMQPAWGTGQAALKCEATRCAGAVLAVFRQLAAAALSRADRQPTRPGQLCGDPGDSNQCLPPCAAKNERYAVKLAKSGLGVLIWCTELDRIIG
jgi:hypothetical protein